MPDDTREKILEAVRTFLLAHECVIHPDSRREFVEKIVAAVGARKLDSDKVYNCIMYGREINAPIIATAYTICVAYEAGELFEDDEKEDAQ